MERHAPFSYRAAHANGALERGTVTAESAEAARGILTRRGLFPLDVRPEPAGVARAPRIGGELAPGLRALATLLGAGLPLGRTLSVFEAMAPPGWKGALPAVRASVREGAPLSAALDRARIGLPPVVVGLIEAGEAGGGLARAVDDAAAFAERDAATRRAIRGALTYPALLAAVGTLSIALLVGFVLPRFAYILQDMGTTLPASTRMVLALGKGARTAAGPGLLVLGVAAVALRSWVATAGGRLRVHSFLLALPLLGPVRRAAAAARFSAALGALLSNGVPMAAALRGAGRATGDAEVERRVLLSRESVIRGGGLALSLAAQRAIPESAVRLVHAGEESGQLVSMLQHAARIEADQAESMTRAAVSAIEPLLIVSLGAGVALIAAALLQAVYSVRPIP